MSVTDRMLLQTASYIARRCAAHTPSRYEIPTGRLYYVVILRARDATGIGLIFVRYGRLRALAECTCLLNRQQLDVA